MALEMRSAESDSDSATCKLPNPIMATPTDDLYPSLTFHTLTTIISAATAGISLILMLALMLRHASRLSIPSQQLKILRIAALVPATAAVNFLGVALPQTYFYLKPWTEFMQALALANFYLLMLEIAAQDATTPQNPLWGIKDLYTISLQRITELHGVPSIKEKLQKRKRRQQKTTSPLTTPPSTTHAIRWILVFQYPVIAFVIAVITDITNAASVYCEGSSSAHFAHIWLKVGAGISAGHAIAIVVIVYGLVKKGVLGTQRPLAKLLAFKIMIGISFLVMIILTILHSIDSSPLVPSATLSVADIYVGIPAMVNCCIMLPISVLFHYAYTSTPYHVGPQTVSGDDESLISANKEVVTVTQTIVKPQKYYGNMVTGMLASLDPREVFFGVTLAAKLLAGRFLGLGFPAVPGVPGLPVRDVNNDSGDAQGGAYHHGTQSDGTLNTQNDAHNGIQGGVMSTHTYDAPYAPAHVSEPRYDPVPYAAPPYAYQAHYEGGYTEIPRYGQQ